MRHRATLIALLVLGAACTSGPADDGSARLLVTASDRSVVIVDPESEEQQVLREGAGAPPAPVQPVASPDGETVVWSELTDDGPRLAVHHDGDTRRTEAPFLPFFSAVSPDGSRLAALGNHPSGDGVALGLAQLPDGRLEIVDRGRPYYLDWHPDGDRLAVHVGTGVLATLTPDGTRTLTGVVPGVFQAPDWTPDGELVAVVERGGLTASLAAVQATSQELAVIDADGGPRVIVGLDGGAAFEVSGDRIAYLDLERTSAVPTGTLAVATLEGEEIARVGEEEVVAFQWSPDGEQLWYLTVDRERLVPWVWDTSGTRSYQPFEPTSTFVAEYLPFWDQYTRTVSVWAPDGSAFVGVETLGGGGQVWIQPLDGERRVLGDGMFASWLP